MVTVLEGLNEKIQEPLITCHKPFCPSVILILSNYVTVIYFCSSDWTIAISYPPDRSLSSTDFIDVIRYLCIFLLWNIYICCNWQVMFTNCNIECINRERTLNLHVYFIMVIKRMQISYFFWPIFRFQIVPPFFFIFSFILILIVFVLPFPNAPFHWRI